MKTGNNGELLDKRPQREPTMSETTKRVLNTTWLSPEDKDLLRRYVEATGNTPSRNPEYWPPDRQDLRPGMC